MEPQNNQNTAPNTPVEQPQAQPATPTVAPVTATAPATPAGVAPVANPPVENTAAPTGQGQQPATAVPAAQPGSFDASKIKEIREAGLTALIMGIVMIIAGGLLGTFLTVVAYAYVVFGVLYLIFGIKLRDPKLTLTNTLTNLKVITIIVIVNLVLSILGGGAGLLTLILLFFIVQSYSNLYKAGFITSKSPFTAKPKV